MKKLLSMMCIFIILSCSPKKIEGVDQIEDNSTEITKLEKLIEDLSSEIDNQNNNVSETPYSEDPNYNQLKKTVDELRSDLIRMIQQLDSKVDNRLTQLEVSYNLFKSKLEGMDDKYVSISDFETLKMNIDRDFKIKTDIIKMNIDNTNNEAEISALKKQILEIKETQSNLDLDYKAYYDKATKEWSVKLVTIFQKENKKQTNEIKNFIKAEVTRLMVTDEGLKKQITHLNLKLKNLANERSKSSTEDSAEKEDARINKSVYKSQILQLENLILENKKLLSNVEEQSNSLLSSSIASDIIHKQFAPCDNGLKESKSCYTLGTMILRLGGQFLDPTHFNRTKKDFIRYLTLSNVTINAVVNKTSSYTVPGSSKNKQRFKTCHENDEIEELIPPHKYWPRSIILSLIMQNIEKDLLKQRELNFISKDISPAIAIGSWWRSQCYHNALHGIDINTPNAKNIKNSDHIYAAAFDPYFKNDNAKSFKFYRDYIETNIWKNDVFEIKHPLKSAKLNFSVGIGLGHGNSNNGKMHIGITSEVDIGVKHRVWPYKANGIKYQDLYTKK